MNLQELDEKGWALNRIEGSNIVRVELQVSERIHRW